METAAPHYIKCGPVPVLRDWRTLDSNELTRGERVIRFIERNLLTPEGERVGEPIVLEDEQRMFFLAIYDNPHGTRTAIKSMARKNGKTAEVAMIVLVHLVGPEAVQNSRIVSGALSREQAAEVYNYASKMAEISPKITPLVRIVSSKKQIFGRPMRVEYQAISAEAKTAHGKSPVLAVLDEVGQVRGPQSDFIDAITTAQGAYERPLLIYISTQAQSDSDLLSKLIDDAALHQPKKTVCHLFVAPDDCNLMDEAAWHMANPALGKYRSIEDLREQADKAFRMPSFENTFRNLILNQRVTVDNPFVSPEIWRENGDEPKKLKGKKVFGGLDLSAVADLTGLVLEDEEGNVECYAWLPQDGIAEKSRDDRVPYDLWAKQGLLKLTPGRAIRYEWVAHELKRIFDEYDVQQINFDRFNMKFLKPELERVGFTAKQLEKFVDFGQGFVSMGPALRSLESALLQKEIKHGMHPILTMCAGNAVVEINAAGDRKFTKKRATGRIDLMVCLAMAEDARSAHKKPEEKKWSVHLG